MTKEQIVKKMIEKAIKGGYDKQEAKNFLNVVYKQFKNKPCTQVCLIITFIFSSDFAKAYWGIGYCECGCKGEDNEILPDWKHYQHKMLDYLQEGKEPLKYIGKFLDK